MAALMRDRFYDPTIPFHLLNAPELSIPGRGVVPSNEARDSNYSIAWIWLCVKYFFFVSKKSADLYSDISEQMIYMLTNNKGLSGFMFRHNQEGW
jgi:hypothetical protein